MSARYTVTIPAETRALKSLRAFLQSVLEDLGCGDAEQIVLAVDEACSNVIKYRCATIEDGQITVGVEVEPDAMQIRVGRFCKTQDIGKIKPRDLEDVRPGGLGTSFIAQIMDRVEFEAEPGQPDCVALVLEKKLEAEQKP